MTTYYKVLKDGKSCHGGSMEWPLPVLNGHWTPGPWVEHAGSCRICESGLHVTSEPLKWYVWGCDVYEAETGEILGQEKDKIVTNKVRLLRQVEHPKWWLDTVAFVESIKTVKWFSQGKLDDHPNIKMFPAQAAARDAAEAAAKAVARDAARDAAWAAAQAAAQAAARDAAEAAAQAAAWDAAKAATRDAAKAAARDAAWAAAQAAAQAVARDAALKSMMILVADLLVEQNHRDYAALRWSVWEAGYGVACDVDGILYCYKKP